MTHLFTYPHKFQFESGEQLYQLEIAYSIYGNSTAKETIWVCHALSGDSEVLTWWAGLFGEGKTFDPAHYRIVCANIIGSCYGSSSPAKSSDPLDFPQVTIRDMVKAHQLLADQLSIKKIDILIGASLGGQQALEWAIEAPDKIKTLILIACNAQHSPYGKAFNQAQRLAILADESYGQKNGGKTGLKAARAIAMLSYRSYDDFAIKHQDTENSLFDFKAASYLNYQGEKFVNRFDAHAYVLLTKAMDSHHIGRGRGSIASVLQNIKIKTLVIGVNSDVLFPINEQIFLADHLPNAEFGIIDSRFGHDAFLIEYQQLSALIKEFLFNDFNKYKHTNFKQNNYVN